MLIKFKEEFLDSYAFLHIDDTQDSIKELCISSGYKSSMGFLKVSYKKHKIKFYFRVSQEQIAQCYELIKNALEARKDEIEIDLSKKESK